MERKLKLAYCAGFFDGEGSISLLKRERMYKEMTTTYFLRASVGQKDGATLDWMKDKFGGNVFFVKRDGSFLWVVTDKSAYDFVKELQPFLKYKNPQALLAIEFYEKYVLPRKSAGARTRLTQEEISEREDYFNQMKALKKVFIKSTYTKSSNND